MESSQSLAIESFSDSWLTSISSSLESLQEPLRASLDSSHEATAEELEYRISKLKISLEEVQNFHFDVPSSPCPEAVVDADQLFSKGLIKPVFISQSKTEAYSSLDLVSKMHSSFSTSAVVPTVHIHCHIFRRWRKAPLRILQKCFRYLRPLCHKISGSIQSTSTDDIDGRAKQIKGQNNLPQASPGTTDWSHIESSIYEAVLHCKRSIGKAIVIFIFSSLFA